MSWYDAIKVAGDAVEKLKNAEANQAMATVRMEGAKLAEENARLREENLALKAAARLRAELRFENNVWWGKVGDRELPHCPKCWGGDQRAVVMNESDDTRWICPVCSMVVRKPGARSTSSLTISRRRTSRYDRWDAPRPPQVIAGIAMTNFVWPHWSCPHRVPKRPRRWVELR